MSFLDRAKQKAEQYDLQAKAKQLADAAEKAAKETVHKAGDLAHDKRDTVLSGLDTMAAKVDTRTHGKYADKVAKAKVQLAKGVDKLAEQRHADTPPDVTPPPQSAPAPAPEPADPTLFEPPGR